MLKTWLDKKLDKKGFNVWFWIPFGIAVVAFWLWFGYAIGVLGGFWRVIKIIFYIILVD